MNRAERVEGALQLLLMLAVGGVAAAASWSHVLALAEEHGQGGWIAWAVAACTETAAISGGLEVRRRHRAGQSARAAVVLVVAATVLQLAAQVAEAQRSPWGVVLAAVPAVTFLALVKLAMSRASGPTLTVQDVQAVPPRRPVPVPTAAAAGMPPAVEAEGNPAQIEPGAVLEPNASAGDVEAVPDELLPVGREIAAELAADGRRLTRVALIEGLRDRDQPIGTTRATELLRQLRAA